MRFAILACLVCSLAIAAEDKPKLTDADRVTLLKAAVAEQQALNALLDAPAYRAYLNAKEQSAKAMQEVEKRTGCKVTPDLECAPPATTPPQK